MSQIVDKAPLSGDGNKPIVAHSTFDLDYNIAGTYRFGEIGVSLVQDDVPDDDNTAQTASDVRSLNLKAPLLGSVKMHKEYIDVPLPAIFPKNYEKFITNPLVGEDVDPSQVGPTVQGFDYHISRFFRSWWDNKVSSGWSQPVELINFCLCLEKIFSHGSLLSSLGIQFAPCVKFKVDETISHSADEFCQVVYKQLCDTFDNSSSSLSITVDGHSYNHSSKLSAHELLEKLRDAHSVSILDPDSELSNLPFDYFGFSIDASQYAETGKPLNLSRPYAYQIAVAEFFTNSKVDYIYSGQLWRQNLNDFIYRYIGDVDHFVVNGQSYEFDACSAHYVLRLLNLSIENKDFKGLLPWFTMVFGFRRSLRFKDYFTSARTRPLAVGDVNVKVNNGYVNIIETIQKKWYSKFLNQINRADRKISAYMRALFPNLSMSHDFHNPLWIGSAEEYINTPESESTTPERLTQAQTTSAVFRGAGSDFAFEYEPQYYGLTLGLIWFDIKRYYEGIIERPNFFVDRDDYFNPFLQFTGDQPIYAAELDSRASMDQYFGYTGAYDEYKKRVSYCFGGFSDGSLSGWIFKAKSIDKSGENHGVIGPDFIRSKPSELDEFYSSLNGLTLSNYFHFVIVNKNMVNSARAMVAKPQLD